MIALVPRAWSNELALLTHVAHPSIVIDSMCFFSFCRLDRQGHKPSDAPHARVRALQAGAVSGQPAVGGSSK